MSCSQYLLRRGSRGECVKVLQTALKALGIDPGPIDGIFGPKTEAAVRAFQQMARIKVDGIVGPQTWGALLSSLTSLGRYDIACQIHAQYCVIDMEKDTPGESVAGGATQTITVSTPTRTTTATTTTRQTEPEAVIHVPEEVYKFIATIGAQPFNKSPFNKLGQLMSVLRVEGIEGGNYIIRGPRSYVQELKRLVDEAWAIANRNVVYIDRDVWEWLKANDPNNYYYFEYYTLTLSESHPQYVVLGTIPEIKKQLQERAREIEKILKGGEPSPTPTPPPQPRPVPEPRPTPTPTPTPSPVSAPRPIPVPVEKKSSIDPKYLMLGGMGLLLIVVLAASGGGGGRSYREERVRVRL